MKKPRRILDEAFDVKNPVTIAPGSDPHHTSQIDLILNSFRPHYQF